MSKQEAKKFEVKHHVTFTTSGGRGSGRTGKGHIEEIRPSTKGDFFGVREEGKKTLTFVRASQLTHAA
ncbi:hypothetical protein ACPRNU_25050 [Chromobacterium vaccinii]|uniref:hypothetical protein n=1 Tax=Chromobacterium vaccinii TaxID=1108595 RepID=UPI003C72E7FD